MESDIQAMIDQAVAEGRVNRLPTEHAAPIRPCDAKFHPDTCGRGGAVERAPFLDELDGDKS